MHKRTLPTLRRAITYIAMAIGTVSTPAVAACHIVTPEAQLCQSGIAAATAFQRLRDARARAEPIDTATLKLLRRSGCVAAGSDYATGKVEEVARGPVGTPTGAIDVVSFRLAEHAYWYIAADSLAGACTVAPMDASNTAPAP